MISHRHDEAALDRRDVAWGLVGVAVTLAITFVGSDGLLWFDAALIGYLFGIIFMVFGVIYRYTVWMRPPSTAMLNRRGRDAFRQRKVRKCGGAPVVRRHPTCGTGLHPAQVSSPLAGAPVGVLGRASSPG